MQWYVIHSKPKQEFRAEQNLIQQGFETFLPTCIVQKVKNKQIVEQKEPLFARYLFIRLDELSSNWFPIKSTRGVHQMLRFGLQSEPIKVQDQLIENLKNLDERALKIQALFEEGNPIHITEGPFRGHEAFFKKLFQEPSGELRAMILIELFGKTQEIKIPVGAIKKYIE
jgi:transcriptional antiterminator RfaH